MKKIICVKNVRRKKQKTKEKGKREGKPITNNKHRNTIITTIATNKK
jgi:hypothetical protein